MSPSSPEKHDPRTIRVASVQMESAPGDKEANFRKVESFTAAAAKQGATLVVFPECCLSGYWFMRNLTAEQLAALAEPVPDGPSVKRLRALAESSGLIIGAGLVEAAPDGGF